MPKVSISDVTPLPAGWDCKVDNMTGKRYYINYFTRQTSMEDPRVQQENIPLQEFSANNRLGLMMGTNSLKRQQSAMDTQTINTTDQSVAKISAMFPTVSETHIRTLLLKYLKSVFPVVEETILLDTLCNSDNNVHQATQTLLTMGFDKKVTPPPRVCLQRETPPPPPPHFDATNRMKSVEEKQEMKVRLRSKHPDIAERVVSIALDSVDFDESRADQILSMVDKPPEKPKQSSPVDDIEVGKEEMNEIIIEEPSQAASPESPPDNLGLISDKQTTPGPSKQMDKVNSKSYQSLLCQPAAGPNSKLRRGPNQSLLLPDYVAWVGSAGLAKGADPAQRSLTSLAHGPDPRLRTGPNRSLSKGSIYSRLTMLSLSESRAK